MAVNRDGKHLIAAILRRLPCRNGDGTDPLAPSEGHQETTIMLKFGLGQNTARHYMIKSQCQILMLAI